ncbi:tyrosine--tRNA ligase [Candidatus Dependentiae bacterium Noda2021]|nr:tyrosine--tRNA ligase [Candidatus Dependentiae bacterium Noda2021]
MNTIEKTLDLLKAGTSAIIPEAELVKKLQTQEPLRIKLGMDPTAPDLHLGHAVVLSKLKQFQDLGHTVIFIIGDFTARIGDPTGKSKTRPPLTTQDIAQHTKTYFDQVGKILDTSKLIIHYNSEWLDKLSTKEMVELCAKVTLARLTERDDFEKRIAAQQPISFHEMLYPLFQGYDSVVLQSDVELGGTDQTFNLLMGRFLQEQYDQKPQVIITTPLLEGLDGGNKMSKSLGNAIGLAEPATQAYGKLMSISDSLMWHYISVLLHTTDTDIATQKERIAQGLVHPMDLKKNMAQAIVSRFWSPQEAENARHQFESIFQKKDYSQAQEFTMPSNVTQMSVIDVLKILGICKSNSEAKRLIEGGAVYVDQKPINDIKAHIDLQSGMIIKAGKHKIFKLV